MNVCYERVSAASQSLLRQDVMMQQYGIERVYTEKISGKSMNRPELKRMLDFVREGDTVVVESISRLARSTRDFLNILDLLEKKKVALVSLKVQIDTTTPTGRFMVNIFAALDQLEREQILQRQKEGIQAQKANGTYTGGRPKFDFDTKKLHQLCQRWQNGEITATAVRKEMGMSSSTFYRRAKENGYNTMSIVIHR